MSRIQPAFGSWASDLRTRSAATVFLLSLSLLAVVVAPSLMPDSYSIIEHSVSESAAQGVEGAWLARLGFLCLGLAVLLCAQLSGHRWGLWGRAAHRLYGVAMLGAAAFSHRPWLDVPFDAFEDYLHSASANAVGFGFTVGVVLVALRRSRGELVSRVFDWTAVTIAVGFSILMFNVDGIAGLVQRIMFLVGYAWYGAEAVRSSGIPGHIRTAAAVGP